MPKTIGDVLKQAKRIADRLDRLGRKPFVLANPGTPDKQNRLDALKKHATLSQRMRKVL